MTVSNIESAIEDMLARKREIDALPPTGADRYTHTQRWIIDSIEVLLRFALEQLRGQ